MRCLTLCVLVVAMLVGRAVCQDALLRTETVSAVVMASSSIRSDGGVAPYRLALLVLWRGDRGWILRGGSGATRGEVIGSEQRPTPQIMGHQISVGNLTFGLRIDFLTNTVDIGGGEVISLQDVNVLLVDAIDRPPRLVQRMWVDPNLQTPDFAAVIKREPALRDFLRCDDHYTDPTQEQMARVLCSRTLD